MSTKLTKEQQEQVDLMVAQAVAKQNSELELKQRQRETNLVQMGAFVQELRVQEGSPIIDKQTQQQKEVNGIPQCYPDKYYVRLQAMGLELETEVQQSIFESLEENRTYLCEGRIALVKKFGSDYIEPVFKKFTLI
ncbi:hypothetical protein CRV02_08320 [Arcobacter sp. CECT 8989]|uniref:hypothetical protein n=1 Tax=Arcobacter sp. CECT 8989 TaxID=2044509 RepID=UPI00100AB107|nr:hypothetical protein [Arcobacter sp. CECT 8989]RXK01504.1 hypothetical protein CRV02_08320 [Arcobacter sp. CECT 8989]